MILGVSNAWAADKIVTNYSFNDEASPTVTAGKNATLYYTKTSVVTNSTFLAIMSGNFKSADRGWNNIEITDQDLSEENWTLTFYWAGYSGCNGSSNGYGYTKVYAGETELVSLEDIANFQNTINILDKTIACAPCNKSTRGKETSIDALNTSSLWYKFTMTGSKEDGVKLTVAPANGGDAVIDNVNVSENNVTPTKIALQVSSLGCYAIDELKLTYLTNEAIANIPAIELTKVSGNDRIYTATIGDGETLHYIVPGGEEQTSTAAETQITVTQDGELVIWTTNGEATSEQVKLDVTTGSVSLADIKLSLTNITAGYGKTFSVSIDNSGVLLKPTATITYDFVPSGEGSAITGAAVTGPIEATEGGTYTFTASAEGYASTTYTFENVEMEQLNSVDVTTLDPTTVTSNWVKYDEQKVVGSNNQWAGKGFAEARDAYWYNFASETASETDILEGLTVEFNETGKTLQIFTGLGAMYPVHVLGTDGVEASSPAITTGTIGIADPEGKYALITYHPGYGTAVSTLVLTGDETWAMNRFDKAITKYEVFKEKAPVVDPTPIIVDADFASLDGWTQDHSDSFFEIGNGLIGTYQVRSDFPASTVDETHLATEYALGLEMRWGGHAAVTQTTATLPAGHYKLTYDVENTNSGTRADKYESLFKVITPETVCVDEKTEWMYGATPWTTHTIRFALTEPATVDISLGIAAGTTNNPHAQTPALYVSHLALESEVVDYTNYIVNADLKGEGGFDATGTKGTDGSGIVKAGNNAQFDFKQTIENLPAGKYKLTAQAAYRYGGDEAVEAAAIAAGTETKLAKLYATVGKKTVEAAVQNRYDGASETDYANGNGSAIVNDKYVPNSSAAVTAWFEAGQYVNEVVFNNAEDGPVTIGIVKTAQPEAGDYTVIGPWTLTRIDDAEEEPAEEEGTDMTSKIVNPSFEDGTTGWTYDPSNDHGAKENSNGTYTMTNCDGNYIFNIWSSGNAISQTVTDLPNGLYKLKAVIATDPDHQVQLNANGKSKKIDASPSGKGVGVEGELEFNVLDNTATIGAEGVNKYWYKVDNFRLFFIKDFDLEDLAAIYETALAEAKAVEGKMNAEVKTALDAVIAANVDKSNADALAAAADALIKATATANNSVAAYAKAKEALDAMKHQMDNTNVYTEDEFNNYNNTYTSLTADYEAGLLSDEVAAKTENPEKTTGWHDANIVDNFLLSAWDTNPDFIDPAPYYINTWSTEGENDGTNFTVPFFEYWTGDANSLGERTLTATMTNLPAGEYDVTAWVRVRMKNGAEAPAYGITFQANDGEAVDVAAGDQVGTSQFFLKEFTATGTVAEDGVLKIKFNVAADNNISWLSFKNVKYALNAPATAKKALEAEIAAAEALLLTGGSEEDKAKLSAAIDAAKAAAGTEGASAETLTAALASLKGAEAAFNTSVGIKSVEVVKAGKTIFNLNGQKIQKTQKGLYVIDGKKVIVK